MPASHSAGTGLRTPGMLGALSTEPYLQPWGQPSAGPNKNSQLRASRGLLGLYFGGIQITLESTGETFSHGTVHPPRLWLGWEPLGDGFSSTSYSWDWLRAEGGELPLSVAGLSTLFQTCLPVVSAVLINLWLPKVTYCCLFLRPALIRQCFVLQTFHGHFLGSFPSLLRGLSSANGAALLIGSKIPTQQKSL